MKTCKQCARELPLAEFYKHPQMADGHLNFCKDCTKARVGDHRERNLERVRAYDRERGKEPKRRRRAALFGREYNQRPEVKRAKQQWTREHADQVRAAHVTSAARWPEKMAARAALCNAVRDGKVLKKPCEKCGSEQVQGHHPDYSKPLDVNWLCVKHHAEEHRVYA